MAQRLGEAPIDHQRLAIFPEHDIAWFQVPVKHTPTVGVLDRVADVDQPAQQLPQFQAPLSRVTLGLISFVEPLDGGLQAVSFDEPHRIKWPPITVLPEPIDRYDTWVLQAAGDLGFEEEP